VAAAAEERDDAMREDVDIPDRRLGLMFACAHPAIDPGVRTALMLQTVLGLNADRIAAAFMVEPQAMGQRLVRAKRKIRDAGVSFEIPSPDEWPARIAPVLDAIYAAYAEGWRDADGAEGAHQLFAEEAVWLGRVLVAQAPQDAEALGLLALMLHLEARRPARRAADGAYVPLQAQDVSLWNEALIADAETLLFRAAGMRAVGRFQLEAAIQSAHAARRRSGDTDWRAIVGLYDALVKMTDSSVVRLNRAAALAEAGEPHAALGACEALAGALGDYQPWWALRAHLFDRLGRHEEARAAFAGAIARERDGAVVRFLKEKAMRVGATVE
jgi:RNA polymerase sigma-70 factor (ECF subfamily)